MSGRYVAREAKRRVLCVTDNEHVAPALVAEWSGPAGAWVPGCDATPSEAATVRAAGSCKAGKLATMLTRASATRERRSRRTAKDARRPPGHGRKR